MKYPERNWPAILKDLYQSGLSVSAYSRKSGIPYSTIMSHKHNDGKKCLLGAPIESMGFVRIEANTASVESSGVRIRIGKAVIEVDEGFSLATLSSVIEVLYAGA